jgi:predicted transcriptional regulator
VSEETDEDALLELLDDEYARSILTATSAEPMSANELSEVCDASVTTVYRRIDRLEEHDLIEEQLRPQPDGNHYKVFAGTLSRVEVDFEDGEMALAVETLHPAEDVADRFTRMWEDL